MAVNQVSITGNLVRDAELRRTQGGSGMLTFTVAVNERKRNQQTGEWEDAPNFIPCVMFSKEGSERCDKLAPMLSKGILVTVAGKLQQSKYEAKDGTSRSKIEVKAQEVVVMQARANVEVYDEEIPF